MVMVSSVQSSSLYMCLFTLGRKQWLVRSKFKFACWVMLLAPHPPEPDTPPLAHPREAVAWGNVTNHAIIPFSALWCLKSLFQLKFLWINIYTTKSCSSSWVHASPTWNTGHPSHSIPPDCLVLTELYISYLPQVNLDWSTLWGLFLLR